MHFSSRRLSWALALLVAAIFPSTLLAQNLEQITAGEFVVENPTLINLGFEWHVSGDTNRNASVTVSYRKVGERNWHEAMPMLRLNGERTYQENIWDMVAPNMFAGSILDLEPGTRYEARFELSDPDGVSGQGNSVTQTVTVSTRPEPMPAAGGKVYHVYPATYEGPREEPSFSGLMCAYNYRCGAGDTAPGGRPRVKPGDVILMHAGVYAYYYEYYANNTRFNATTPFEGTYYLTADGTAERPIVIKAAGDGEVVIDGRGAFNLFNLKAADYNYFEGITFRNTDIAIWAGTQFIAGSKGLTVKHSRFEDVGIGIWTNYSGSSDFTILDNVFIGRNDPSHVIGWVGAFWQQFGGVDGQTFPPVMASYTAVRLYGPGHVVAYNHIQDFHDGIDVETYGNPDGSHAVEGPQYPTREFWDRRPVAIDFYNNYLSNFHDNAIEIDGSLHNVRVMRNMLLNSASHPMSNQPTGGGPIYWIRNIVYHAPGGATRMTGGAPGVLYYNNSIFTESVNGASANMHWRNNVILGQNYVPAIFTVNTNTGYSSSDFNGFRPNPGAQYSFHWNAPEGAMTLIDGVSETAKAHAYGSLEEYSTATGNDRHSVLVDYSDFVSVTPLDAQDLNAVQRVYEASSQDFRLRRGATPIDKGTVIPNVTDGFNGRAPDLGAVEFGEDLPVYGPRR